MTKAHAKLLNDILYQLKAMNTTQAHAVSWVEPRSDATTKMIKRIENALKDNKNEV